MVSAVGISAYGAGAQYPSQSRSHDSVAALQGQIQQNQVQLNDWTTCVSARTPKGQAAIQKLSGEINAAKEQIHRTLQSQFATASTAHVASISDSSKATYALGVLSASDRSSVVDLWV